MPKIGMGPVRKRAFVEAAIRAIHEKGFTQLTMADVAREAGVSAGLIHHYLGSKETLLTETMRFLLNELQRCVQERLAEASTPQERLDAIIESSFDSVQMEPATVSAWLAFYVQAQRNEETAKLLTIYSRRLHSNLVSAYRAHLPLEEARCAAHSTAGLIDGFWLRAVLVKHEAGRHRAITLLRRHVAQQLKYASDPATD